MKNEILRLDIDSQLLPKWQKEWIETRKAILEKLGIKLVKTIIRPSGQPAPWLTEQQKHKIGKGKGYHAWLHIQTPKPLTDQEKLKLQFLLGDDPGRVWINHLRITKRKNPNWNKIFGYILYRKPLNKKCQNCPIKKALEEIACG